MSTEITVTLRKTFTVPDYGTHLYEHDLIKLVKDSGSHFFDADTMRGFKSRLHDIVPGIDGWYFVTSEKHEAVTSYRVINEPRKYTVRRLRLVTYATESNGATDGDLKIDTIGEFQEHATLRQARKVAQHYAKTGAVYCDSCGASAHHEKWCQAATKSA